MIGVDYIAVLLAAVASMVVGFVWYSPFVLGKPWMKLMGYASDSLKAAQKEMMKTYGVSFVLTLVTAFVLFHFVLSPIYVLKDASYSVLNVSLTYSFFVWLGFVMPVQATEVLFGKKPVKLFGINTGYQLVSLLVMGVVIGLVR